MVDTRNHYFTRRDAFGMAGTLFLAACGSTRTITPPAEAKALTPVNSSLIVEPQFRDSLTPNIEGTQVASLQTQPAQQNDLLSTLQAREAQATTPPILPIPQQTFTPPTPTVRRLPPTPTRAPSTPTPTQQPDGRMSWKKLKEYEVLAARRFALDFNPITNLVALSSDGDDIKAMRSFSGTKWCCVDLNVKVVDLEGRIIRIFPASRHSPLSISPDGRAIAYDVKYDVIEKGRNVGIKGNLVVNRILDGTQLISTDRGWGPLRNLIFSPDGNQIATSHDDQIKIWGASDGSLVRTIERDTSIAFPGMHHIRFSPDGKLLAVGSFGDKSIGLLDLANGSARKLPPLNDNGTNFIDFTLDGNQLITNSGYQELNSTRIWDVKEGKLLNTITTPIIRGSELGGEVRWVPGTNLLAQEIGADYRSKGKVIFWDRTTLKEVSRVSTPELNGTMNFTSDGKRMILGTLAGFSVWQRS
ncbi:hypothetical protein A3C32_00820 [Candidatus Daviesbacteria bacterium RIFCSPHIGHO2_02_FULL_41_14]|uniref:Anaphase-promoting complex subunit 4 WD40 domain-containing protein n=1 Tax=Candidatus Daviesbacteria bacterium RIFCSPLOWO2_01_FULL_40_24 TaxID=1797787 RepID=A0A1F5MKC6_9BACT|nr:MAG: hypothetical protein A2780_01835 [Candidatus Daviesbacteria bacterium RIFCSPHIGHO2_01_FULL_41_45]OGE34121.1 MAG: hypothetical protein A3C32_00820 [Candidatus Daviesbacteria bacterium RIFCSPHIGHO2_02_FULL_41_14]OGE65803.1 MAG: hypothetical protein A3B49_03325 [Candidatus Daviesbacteria bacterium RIFCSPLOWO2_01_FULL_40_24]